MGPHVEPEGGSGRSMTGGIFRFCIARYHVVIDVPHLLVLLGIEAFCAWYLMDARAASTDVQNLLLIEPAAILAFIFFFFILRDIVKITPAAVSMAPRDPLASTMIRRIIGSMALLGLYVGAMPYAGFDVATAAYVFASLVLLGERRIFVLVIAPIVFTAITISVFKAVVSIPLPLFFGATR
jgi:hypothetical protein